MTWTRFAFTFAAATCCARIAVAQADPRAAQPERPTVSIHAGSVAPGYLEVEGGVERDEPPHGASVLVTGVSLKVGLAPRVQAAVSTSAFSSDGTTDGIGDVAVAVKWRLADHLGPFGSTALLARVTLPAGDEQRGTGTGGTGWSLRAISSRDFGNHVHVDANVRFAEPGNGADAEWLWSVAAGRPLTSRVSLTSELSGVAGTGSAAPSVAFLFGPSYAPRPWMVLDAGIIARVAGQQPVAAYVGLTYNAGRVFGAAR